MKKFLSVLCLLTALGLQSLAAQNVTGEVVDQNQDPLPGATIQVKGTSLAVATNVDGLFQINGRPGQTLTASYVGYETASVVVPANSKVKITLREASSQLDEVVVVGVSLKKSDLTGAIANVDADVLTQKPVTSINDALAGRVAGLKITPSSSPSEDSGIRIRGTNTINSGSSPIYVVDGVVMGNDFGFFNSINLNDVASVQVLKDASATALYGSRGANGVIVITTKKAAKGDGNGQVNYDGWVSFSTIGHRPETMNAQQLFDLRTEAYANGYMYNNPDADRNAYIQDKILGSDMAFHQQEFAGYRSGKSFDWLKQVTQTGFQQNHNVSFTKATDTTNFYFSLGLSDLDGIVKGTEQQRYSGRINASADITPWLKVGTNSSYTYQKDKITTSSVYAQALYNGNPLIDYAPYADNATRKGPDYLTLFWRVHSEENNNNFNPFNSLDVDTDRSRYHLNSANYIDIHPIEGLHIRSTFAIVRAEQSWNQFQPDDIQETIRHKSGQAYATQQRFGLTQWQWDNSVRYERTFNALHRMDLFASTSTSRRTYNDLKAEGQDFPSNDLGYDGLFANANEAMRKIYNSAGANSLLSYVVRGNYSYDYRYFFTFTGRWDGSSKFGKGHRWGFFPSFSAAWDITNERFFPKLWYLNQIKLRGGYGTVGNQDIADFMYLTLYTPSVSNGKPIYSTDGRRGTPDITWEKQKQGNIGIDLSFLNRRLNFTLDAFFIKNSNLLMSHDLATTSGYSKTTENIGELTNRGFEMSISGTPVATKEITWNINANLGLDRNKITTLYGGVERVLSGDRTGNLFVGEPLSSIYALRAAGIANEWNRSEWENLDFNGHTIGLGDLYMKDISGPDDTPDGVIDAYDRDIIGKLDPKFYGGFSTDITWKGLTLNAVFDYSVGGHAISSYYEGLVSSFGQSNASTDLLDRWSPDNVHARFPRRITNASGYSAYTPGECDYYLQSTSYLRLSNLSLSYLFPQRWTSKAHLRNLRLYFTASNVFTITGYKGFDPEMGDGNGYFPTKRTYTIGLSFSIF